LIGAYLLLSVREITVPSITTNNLSARELLRGLQDMLAENGLDYEQTIKDFGQVAASEARAGGRVFTLRDHTRGLLLSQLSNQRPWARIAALLDRIGQVFLEYDPDALQRADPLQLEAEIRALSCGNRAIREQMKALSTNIATLRRIEKENGSLDKFVTSRNPDAIAKQLSELGSPYKLRYVGYTLAMEYLRNVGVRAAKPDVHVCRILGGERLAFLAGVPTEQDVVQLVATLADEAACNPTYLDNLLWLFCALDYGNICGAKPKCTICTFRDICLYPAANAS
jgi:hypothetical protein